MLFTTTTQWVVLALALVAGWLLGLASHPGGRRWKERYVAERDAHAAARKDADTRIATGREEGTARARTAEARVAELERENDRLRRAAPVTAATVAPVATSAARPAVDARPTYTAPVGERRGWFDWGRRA